MDRTTTRARSGWVRPAIAGALLALAAAAFAQGERPPAATGPIELRDAEGRVRVRLGVDERGRAALRMLDAQGRSAFRIVVPAAGGVSVQLDHADGNFRTRLDGARVRITSSAVDDRGRMLKMSGRELALDATGPAIELRDNAHDVVWSVR